MKDLKRKLSFLFLLIPFSLGGMEMTYRDAGGPIVLDLTDQKRNFFISILIIQK